MAPRESSCTALQDWVLQTYYAPEGAKGVARHLEWKRPINAILGRVDSLESNQNVFGSSTAKCWSRYLRTHGVRSSPVIDFLMAAQKMAETMPAVAA